jgi:hypothetical protein
MSVAEAAVQVRVNPKKGAKSQEKFGRVFSEPEHLDVRDDRLSLGGSKWRMLAESDVSLKLLMRI